MVRATAGILENFREAYWSRRGRSPPSRSGRSSSRTCSSGCGGEFATSLLLGEAHQPEGNSIVTFGNALSRLVELRHVAEARRRGTRDRWIEPGPAYDRLPELTQRLRSGVGR